MTSVLILLDWRWYQRLSSPSCGRRRYSAFYQRFIYNQRCRRRFHFEESEISTVALLGCEESGEAGKTQCSLGHHLQHLRYKPCDWNS